MPIRPARVNDLQIIRQLIRRGRHVYTNFGSEDLVTFLRRGAAVLGVDSGRAWGFLCIETEPKPETLPAHAPGRAFLRSVVLTSGRSPVRDVAHLIEAATTLMQTRQGEHSTASSVLAPGADSVQVLFFGTASWLLNPLQEAGFRIIERVEYLQLDRLQRRRLDASILQAITGPHPVQLRGAQTTDLDALARLDAETFAVRWHFSSKQMLELLLACRVQVAVQTASQPGLENQALVGYAALSIKPQRNWMDSSEAQLARLAVHPRAQGSGVGRRLLADSVLHAQEQGIGAIVLNTQTDNRRAQKLYRTFGFRSTGQITPVLIKSVRLA